MSKRRRQPLIMPKIVRDTLRRFLFHKRLPADLVFSYSDNDLQDMVLEKYGPHLNWKRQALPKKKRSMGVITKRIGTHSVEECRKEYYLYLKSFRWKRLRKEALLRAGHVCSECGNKSRLQVHHVTYERLGAELPKDLQVLCRPCHLLKHPDKNL